MEGRNVILKDDSEWSEGTILLLNKWERVCKYRKKAHATSARSYGWKNKFLSIPTILISTILGSLSFIHPSFMGDNTSNMSSSGSRMLSPRNLFIEYIPNGNCIQICGGSNGECPDIGMDDGSVGFWDCECCYTYWEGCSFSECSDWCYPNCNYIQYPTLSPVPIVSSIVPTYMSTAIPTPLLVPSPTKLPTPIPTLTPTYIPTLIPTHVPTFHPTFFPTLIPTHIPTNKPSTSFIPSTSSSSTHYISYIIGVFNMVIAILSALHTFLKYDTLEDRHNQYSRHFGNLKVDLETLLAKPIVQRGSAGTMIERYKTKYTVLINNAPELAATLEQSCWGAEDIVAIELT